MKMFDVYRHPNDPLLQAVKTGFSWPAFCFSWIWAFVKKAWGLGWALLAVGLSFAVLLTVAMDDPVLYMGVSVGNITAYIVIGFHANRWRKENLEKRGYELIQSVAAATPDGAIASVMTEEKAAAG